MRIVHFIDSLSIGGAETLLKDTIIHYKKIFPEDKHVVVTLRKVAGYEELIRKEASCYNLDFSFTNIWGVFRKYRTILKDECIDVVHSHLNESTIIARLFTPSSVPLVSTYHSGYLHPKAWNYSFKRKFAERVLYKKSHYCLFVSSSVSDVVVPALNLKENYEILENFYDDRFFPAYEYKNDSRLRLVTVGNLTRQKNQILLLNVLKELGNSDVSLDIYGEGSLRAELQQLIDDNQLNVRLKGRAFITSELLGAYDLFVMSSLDEGFGIALVEAMATGLPSLLPDLPALKEVAKESGLYFKRNSVKEALDLLNYIIEDKEILRRLSVEAIEASKEYTVSSKVHQLNQIYKKLAAKK